MADKTESRPFYAEPISWFLMGLGVFVALVLLFVGVTLGAFTVEFGDQTECSTEVVEESV